MKEDLRLDRKELCKYLNVTDQALRGIIRRKQLEDRINRVDKHYKLSDVNETPGKNTIYVLKYVNDETFKQWQSRVKIKNKNKEIHKKYVIERIKKPRLSRSELITICEHEILYHTAYKYDKILEKERFIEKDGYEYRFWRSRGESERITEEEYKNFWYKNRKGNNMISKYVKLYKKGKISDDEFEKLYYEVQKQYPEMDGFAYRFTAYRNLKDAEETLNWIGSD